MRLIGFAAAALAAGALAACGGGGGNQTNATENVADQEGVHDINSAVSGDELTPIPEASDDMAGNGAVPPGPANGAEPNQTLPRPPG